MKQYTHLAVPLLIAAACTGGDQRSPTAPSVDVPQNGSGTASHASTSTGVRIIDLGTLAGGWPSAASAINGGRVIAGWSFTGANYSGEEHAVRWQESTPGSGSWAIHDLSTLIAGSTMSSASAINANGDIAGWMRTGAGDFAFLLTSGGTLKVIAPPAGMNATFATGINGGGAVVGYAVTNPDPNHNLTRAFYYGGGTTVALPTLSGTSQANSIRDDGTVVGYSFDAANESYPRGVQRAVEWTRNVSGTWTIARLPSSANTATEANEATAISSTGKIAGGGCPNLSPTGCSPGARAYFWASDVTTPTVLGTLGGNISTAYGVNDAGDIAGWSTTSHGLQRAFFSASGGGVLTDLGSLVTSNGSSTAAGLSGHLVVGLSEAGAGRVRPFHATLWIVP
jgi:probable HAF family extracellular repeat protein